jgi:deoxyribonucleoside regulator
MDLQRRQLAQISFLYYEKNMTQQEISKITGLSRIKVSRLLQKAKDMGIVKITVDYSGSFLELENKIAEKYKLKDVIIVDDSIDTNTKNMVASAAAYYLENNLTDECTVAVGWGTTLRLVQNHIHPINKKVLFSPIIGGHGKSEFDNHASTIASNLAKKTECRSLSLLAPAFAQTSIDREILLNDNIIQEVLSASAKADFAVFSLGNPLISDNSIEKSGYLSDKDMEFLHKENALCDVVSILFLNDKGKNCCENITNRSIGIKPEELKNIPVKICVIEGEAKYITAKIALEAGFIDVLILDNKMAEYLLEN